jgi:hypothetical protein
VQLKNTSSFPHKDRQFILAELKRHFDRERMFVISPNVNPELSAAAKALTEDSLMHDLKFKETAESGHSGPNATVRGYFARMLPIWGEGQRTVSFKEILAEFNSGNKGIYRRTCIVPFMQPLILAGVVELQGADAVRIDVDRAVVYFEK